MQVYSPEMQAKFDRVSAAVKGYLTRRLMRTQKVQSIINTIRVGENKLIHFKANV